MPDYRTHTLVADRSDVDFHKRPDPLRENRRKWIWLAGVLGVWPLAWQLAGKNDQTIYWAATVSTSHQMVQHDCQKCHREWCQTFRMNFMSPEEIRVIEANTCQTCHWEDTRDHNPGMVVKEAKGCFDCHAEHRHKPSLSEVADVYCTDCHRDLRIKDRQGIRPSPSFVASIISFDDHPEFALRRFPEKNDSAAKRDPSHHKVFSLVSLPSTSSPSQQELQGWSDGSNFRFNHARHLAKEGLPLPANSSQGSTHESGEVMKVLNCADCHELDNNGEYFQPINFEKHCAQCHALNFSKELNQLSLNLSETTPLPHESPNIIRGTLRDRLTTYINNHPELIAPSKDGEPAFFPHIGKEKGRPALETKAEWVEYQLAVVEAVVQGKKQQPQLPKIQKGCVKCHFIDPADNANGVSWTIRPTNIPDRWLPHSRFRHDRHDMLECYDCHHTRPAGAPLPEDVRSDPHSIFQSETAEDILMPSITTCRSCHGSPVGTPLPGRVKARTDCIECHVYHHTLSISPAIRDRWDLEDGKTDVKSRLWRTRKVPVSFDLFQKTHPAE